MEERFGLNTRSISLLQAVFKNYPEVEKAIIYGSRALGTYKNGSDIDLTLTGKGLTHTVMNRLRTALDELPIPYMIDLSVQNDINDKDLNSHIERAGVVFYEKAGDK